MLSDSFETIVSQKPPEDATFVGNATYDMIWLGLRGVKDADRYSFFEPKQVYGKMPVRELIKARFIGVYRLG